MRKFVLALILTVATSLPVFSQDERVTELERKVSGMQKQITRLHAIREDLENRLTVAEKKITHIVRILKLRHEAAK